MQTLQLTKHTENYGQVHLMLPSKYANQEVELVVIIQSCQAASERKNWLDFLNQTYGCLADDPIERPEQAELKEIDFL